MLICLWQVNYHLSAIWIRDWHTKSPKENLWLTVTAVLSLTKVSCYEINQNFERKNWIFLKIFGHGTSDSWVLTLTYSGHNHQFDWIELYYYRVALSMYLSYVNPLYLWSFFKTNCETPQSHFLQLMSQQPKITKITKAYSTMHMFWIC